MNKLKLLIGIILFNILVCDSLIAQNEVLKKFQHHFNQTQTFVADFKQEYYDSLLDQISVSTGKIYYKKTGRMHWDYKTPDLMQIIIGTEKIWIYEPDLENVTIQYLDQVSRLDALSFLLKNEAMEKHFTITEPEKPLLDELKFSIPLYLKPKKESPHIFELQLALNKNTYRIMQFILIDHQRNHRKISFENMVLNLKIDDSRFEFVITEGMEVIDEMDN